MADTATWMEKRVAAYDKLQIELCKHSFMLYRADVDKEIWVLVSRGDAEVYLRQKRFGWRLWDSRKRIRLSEKQSLSLPDWNRRRPLSFCFVGTLEEAMAELKKIGLEENHIEVFPERGAFCSH